MRDAKQYRRDVVAMTDAQLQERFGDLCRERDDLDRRFGIVSDEVHRRYVLKQKRGANHANPRR